MNAPMIDFRSCNGLQTDTMDFLRPQDGVVFSCGAADSDPPDVVVFSNPLDHPVVLEVIDVPSLFRDAPDEIVETLFLRQWSDETGRPFRMAEPDLATGETLFRGYTTSYPITNAAGEVLLYLSRNASRYAVRVTLMGGEEIAVDNLRQMVRFVGRPAIERRYAWTRHLGDDATLVEQEPENARI